MRGLSRSISCPVGVCRLVLITFRTLARNGLTFFLDGLMSSLSPYLRTLKPRKSKPSSICVMTVFSGESSSPRSPMNYSTRGLTSSSSGSFELPWPASRRRAGLGRAIQPGEGRPGEGSDTATPPRCWNRLGEGAGMLVLLVAHERLSLGRRDQVGVHLRREHSPGRAPFTQDDEDGKPIIYSWRGQLRTHKDGVEAVTLLALRSTGGPQGSRLLLLPKTTQARPPASPTAQRRPAPA